MLIKSKQEVAIMAEAGKKLRSVLQALKAEVRPGITTLSLDKLAERLIIESGAKVSFKGYQGYPHTLCASVNDQVVHCFPSERILKEGDIVSLDLGLIWQGWQSDSALTVGVGKISPEAQRLMDVTEESLWKGIDQIKPGNTIGDIGAAVQEHAERAGFGVVRSLTGHGIGRKLHEPPAIPNYGKRHKGFPLQAGMVIAVEPMVTIGSHEVDIDDINWTVKTVDGSLAAHYEHTIAITEHGHTVLTA
ncbi:type I methionyl aminopeptidase [Candidatus Gracilibacteria bacterium]|nr:type I methionyl aminopeptidase [Candidatus Gracilibacteria bacterium]